MPEEQGRKELVRRGEVLKDHCNRIRTLQICMYLTRPILVDNSLGNLTCFCTLLSGTSERELNSLGVIERFSYDLEKWFR